MVKRQKEKQYQSRQELKTNSSLRAGGGRGGGGAEQRRLPFNCCALTLTPFEQPVCTSNGIVFENTALLPFLLKYKVDPVTGKPLKSRDVIRLHMDKDEESGQWQCPIMTKKFSDHTKVVAIRHGNEANVYSWQAYQELNLKGKNMEDLISGEKFTKKDVLILNDPENEEFNKLRDINNFHHVLNARSMESNGKPSTNVQHSVTATRIMEKLTKRTAASMESKVAAAAANKKPRISSEIVTGKRFTSGATSGSLTSSSVAVSNTSQFREATEEEILVARFGVMRNKLKKKGYATIQTNMGDIGLELHCDMAPRTCTNFLGLAEAGKYIGTKFHRLIPTFMIQGGKGLDPKDDVSLWGGSFVDEFDDRLVHDAEGILSMANAGPKTNKRQFFLTFGPTPHLDRKHSIFGKVIQGMEILREMKKVPTDKKDRPVHEIIITNVQVLVNPAKEAEEMERIRIEKAMNLKQSNAETRKSSALGKKHVSSAVNKPADTAPASSSAPAVGKYLAKNVAKKASASNKKASDGDQLQQVDSILNKTKATRLPPPPKKTSFGNFSGW